MKLFPSHSNEKKVELVLGLALWDQPVNRTANNAVKAKALRSSKRAFHREVQLLT